MAGYFYSTITIGAISRLNQSISLLTNRLFMMNMAECEMLTFSGIWLVKKVYIRLMNTWNL